jgi:soluble cytochrome b562
MNMKRSIFFVSLLMAVMVAVVFIGCSKTPETEKAAAKTAMEAAVSEEAPRYARADFEAAMKLWDTAEDQVKEKKYPEAKQGYIDAKAAFEKASDAVAAGKKAVAGEVNTDELKATVARVEEDWKNLQTLAKKVEAKLEKKKPWEADAKTFSEGLNTAKDMIATDPVSAKLKIDSLKPFISSYTELFKQLEAAPEKRQRTK